MGQYSDLTDEAQGASPASAPLAVRIGSETSPDTAAQALQLARRFQLPPGVAETFVEDYKARALTEDSRAAFERAPRLGSWISENQVRAAAAQDDIGTLAEIEKAVGGMASYVMGARPDGGMPNQIVRGIRQIGAGAGPQFGASVYGALAYPFEAVGMERAGEFLRNEQRAAQAVAERIAGPANPEAGIFERSVMSGLRSAGQQVPSLGAGLMGAGATATLGFMGATTFGSTYGKGRDEGLSVGKAGFYGLEDATAEVVTERFAGAFGLLADAKAGMGAVKLFVRDIAREIPGEMGATLWQNFNEWLNVNPDKPLRDFLAEQPAALGETIIATIVGAGAQTGAIRGMQAVSARLGGSDQRAQQAEQVAADAEALRKLAEASKLRGRDAESFREFVQQVADEEGDAPTEFYIDGETLVKTLDQSGITMQELEAIAPVVASQIEAAMTGGDVRVPVSEFLSAGEAVTAPLVDHLRMTPEGMSRAEAQDYMKEQGDRIQREVEAELQRVDDQAQFRQSIEAVRAEFEAELSSAKRFTADVNRAYADLLANFYGATAARLGMTPQELLAKYRLRVQSKLADGQRVMEQGAPDTPEFRNWFGDSKVVDQQGRPLVVYHGTGADVSEFRPGVAKAIWFAPDAGYAGKYVSAQEGASNNLIPVFLTVKNPLTVDMRGGANLPRGLKGLLRYANTLEDVVGIARQQGHDGVIFKNRAKTVEGFVADEVAVFEPTQIKSAIGNRGTFDPADPSILNQGETPRAQISLPQSFEAGPAVISLLENADLSSFLHESGHLFLEIQADLAIKIQQQISAGASVTAGERQIVEDMNRLLEWFGVKGVEQASGATGGALDQPAFHGTPHRFDKFTTEKIGTGEGAQAYGWGLYFASKREIAEYYRNTLSQRSGYTLRGKSAADLSEPEALVLRDIERKLRASDWPEESIIRLAQSEARAEVDRAERALAEARAQVGKQIDAGAGWGELRYSTGSVADVAAAEARLGLAKQRREIADGIKPGDVAKPAGQLYEVEVPEDDTLLLWDKPLSEQPEKVREALAPLVSDMAPHTELPPGYKIVAKDVRGRELFAPMAPGGSPMSNTLYNTREEATEAALDRLNEFRVSAKTKGAHLYSAINRDQRAASEALAAAGIKGIKYLDGTSRGAGDGSYNYVIFSGDDVAIRQTFYQGGSEGAPPGPSPQGRTPLETWALMSLEEKRQYHEQFARGFEAYAFEGEAPSLELAGIFQRFRSWLLQVYQTLRNLKVELNDDVRAVIGRMLASDFAIEEAEAARNMGPLFKDAESAGMALDEFNAYQGLARGATEDAIAQLQARGLKDMRWLSRARDKALKARQQEVEELRREVRQEVRAEVLTEPVYRAWQFLTGRVSDADKVDAPAVRKSVPGPVDNTVDSMFVAIAKMGGLRRDAAAADLGIDPKQRSPMPLFGKPLLLRDGGLTQDAMAERLGEQGYLTLDENGKVDIAEFQEKFQAELRGIKQYSYAKDYADAQGLAADAGLNIDGAERGKLDLSALIERYGPADARIAKLKALRMTAKAGWDFDAVAENFGFDSGDALVTALTEATPPAETIEARTDQRMLEMFGDITSPQALQRAADEAVHNEARARVIAAELKALQAANRVREGNERTGLYRGGTVNILAKAAKEYAQQIVNRLPVRNIRPAQYAAAEARSARLAEKALAAGKLDEAAMHKRNQLVNNYAAKAAYEAQANVKKSLDFFGKVNTGNAEKIAETRDVAMVNVARAVLAEYGIGTKGKTALEYLDAVESNDPELATVLRDRVGAMTAGAMPYKDMSVERVLGLADEVRALWAMAKRTRQIEIDGKLIDRARAQMDIAQRLEELGVPERIPGEGRAVTEAERRTGMLRSAWAALRRVESWADLKDAGSVVRPFRRYVWQPIRDAADRYRADKAKYLKAYRDLLKTVDLGRSRIDAPELGYTFGFSRGGSGKQEILHALLHTGNDSNKRKLLVGRGWGQVTETGELDSNRWDTFIRRMVDQGVLTKADFDFVQGVWDLLEQIKPLAQKAHRDVFGRYFDEVTAQSFDTPFGTYRGGYVPALADPEVVSDAKTRALVEAENQTLALAFPQTARGFTKARVEYNKPLLLDLRSLGQHIDKVLMFSHLEQPVRDVRKVLASKEVSQPMSRADPAAFDGLLTPWLNRVARQQVETPVPGSNGLMRFFTKARSRAGMAAMFANVVNTAQQITGLSIAAVKVKPRHLLHAAAQMVHSPRKTAQAVAEASPYMATRMDNEIAQATDAINDILLNPSVYERAQAWSAKHAYFMQSAVDNFIGPIVWQGAYNQALEAGETEADAVRLADSAVRQTQGSTLPEDIARFESGNAFVRMFTQFASYFNMQANLLGSEFAVLARDLGLRRGAGRGLYVFLFGFLAPALVSELIVQAARGGPGDDDDDGEYLDDWLAALMFGVLRSGVAMVPVAGQIATTAANMANSKPYDDRMSTSPAISMIESAVRAPTSVYEAIAEDKSAKKAIRDVATLITMTTGLPATAVARPLGYAADVAQDKVDPTGPIDAARGAVTGVASPASK